MSSRRVPSLLFACAVGLALWTACASDYDAAEAPRGGEGQECFENRTCFGALVCASGRCVVAIAGDAGGAPPGDGGSSSPGVPPGASLDGGAAGSCRSLVPTSPTGDDFVCPLRADFDEACANGERCCVGRSCESPITGCPAGPAWSCFAPKHCGASSACCLRGVVKLDAAPACTLARTLVLTDTKSSSRCATFDPCDPGEVTLCVPGEPGGCKDPAKCVEVSLRLSLPDGSPAQRRVGACVAP